MIKKRRISFVFAVLIAAALISAGALLGSVKDQWTTEKSNDVKISQNVIVDFLTPNDNKDFKFSFSRPIEIIPGYWCVFLNSDMHTQEYGPDNFPYQHCWSRKELTDAQVTYMLKWQVSLAYVARWIGTGNHPKTWPEKN